MRETCVHAAIANIFALLDGKKLPSGFTLGETPQEEILRPAAFDTTGQCESRETSPHTKIPISRPSLNYVGERKVPYLWPRSNSNSWPVSEIWKLPQGIQTDTVNCEAS